MLRSFRGVAALVPVSILVVACSTGDAPSSTAPQVDGEQLTPRQTQPYGSVTLNAGTPEIDSVNGLVRGTMTWTGSGTYSTGACLLVRVETGPYQQYNECNELIDEYTLPVGCNSDSDCSSYAPTSVGGSAHCRSADGVNPKYCYVRPGPRATWCVGTPANGQQVTAPTTRTTGWQNAYMGFGYWSQTDMNCRENYGGSQSHYDTWILDGCLNGCSGSTPAPSDSPEATYSY